ncbi:retrovirus-related pol polyprotein from transposon TNT 1-94 [Tanacetum coccineum]
MALGYQNPFYLKQAQQKQQSLYNGKILLEKHDPPVVYDSEETLQLAQESRLKIVSNLVSKSILIPNEEFLDDTSSSVARKFLNEVKSTIVTLQRVVKQKMTLDIHNWSSSAHQELLKIVKDEIHPIVNQVDVGVQNFKIQFLKEVTKFVRDFKSLANEADESIAKHKSLEFEIERLLRAVVSQDIMSIVQNPTVVETFDLQIELEQCKYDKISYDKAYKDMQQKIERLQAQLGDQKGKSEDTPCVSDTVNPLSQKLSNENVELEFQVLNYAKENAHLKTTYKNLFDSINVTQTQTKIINDSLQEKLLNTIYKKAKLRAQLFDKVSEQKDITKGTSVNTKFTKQSILGKPPSSSKSKQYSVTPFPNSKVIPKVGESNALSNLVTSNSAPSTRESKVMKNINVIAPGMFRINPSKTSRIDNVTPNTTITASIRTKPITTSQPHNDKFEVGGAMCNQCLITSKHDVCVINYVNDMNSRTDIHSANVTNIANKKKHKPHAKKPKKFLGTICFGNGHTAAILGYGDLKWGNILITKVYSVEGLGHNLFSVGQFCDSDLEVAFRRKTCFVRNLEGVDLLKGNSIATACYTQNRSIIHRRFGKTPYELINDKKPDISFLQVFRALCYPKNDREDIGKLGAKGYIGLFISYSANSCAYRVYNLRTKKIMETINVTFDELSAMAFEQHSSKPELHSMTSRQISSGLDLTYGSSIITTQKPTEHELDLLFEAMFDDYIGGQPSAAPRIVLAAQAP